MFRYDFNTVDDGVGGEEGAFSLCTLWAIEAMTRVGSFGKTDYLRRAMMMVSGLLAIMSFTR